jgi:hypothetical protein
VPAFFAVIGAFLLLHVVIPSLKQLWNLPAKPKLDLPPPNLPPPTVVAMLARTLPVRRRDDRPQRGLHRAMPESVTQQIRVEDTFALATAKIHWQADKGQVHCRCCSSRRC